MKFKLKAMIYEAGYKQCDIARQLGWREARISAIITGRQEATEEDVEKLAAVLGVLPSTIMEALQ